MKLIIDRFEEDYAVCEDEQKNIVNINKKDIPQDANEGDILILVNGKYKVDKNKTQDRKKYIEDLTKNLWE